MLPGILMDRIPEGAIWVRFPRFIGDSVMIHQAIAPLHALGPDLVAWGPAHVMELFRGAPGYAATVSDPPVKPNAFAMGALLRKHRARGVICLARSQRATTAALLARIPIRVGWREGMGGLICSRSIRFKSLAGHQQERYGQLLRAAFPGLPEASSAPFRPRPEAQVEADALLAKVPLPFVVFSLGAMSANKRLSSAVWIELGRKLLDQGRAVVLLGSTQDDLACAQSIRTVIGEVHDLAGKTSLAVAAGVIRRASTLFGNDSALSHLAAACATPTVAAFGPTDEKLSAPQGAWVRVVRRENLACARCMSCRCHVPGLPCMEGIRSEDLLAAMPEAAGEGLLGLVS
jgi:ADP-heptose:LPS heptosyltransferase